MNELELSDLYEVAARATINERCGAAYLHDIRGSMQALFSALELLGRSAKSGSNPERTEKACDLARRAIDHHEKATLGALQVLTLQPIEAAPMELVALLKDTVRFLRTDASSKHVTVTIDGLQSVMISANRAKLQTLLVGLLAAAIDAALDDTTLPLSINHLGDHAVVSIGSMAGYEAKQTTLDWVSFPHTKLSHKELTLLFAQKFLKTNGGRLEIDAAAVPRGVLRLYYPVAKR